MGQALEQARQTTSVASRRFTVALVQGEPTGDLAVVLTLARTALEIEERIALQSVGGYRPLTR